MLPELLPGLLMLRDGDSWTGARSRRTGYALHLPAAGVLALIDPPPLAPEEAGQLERRQPPTHILLTCNWHLRGGEEHRRRWGCPILVHEAGLATAETAIDGTFRAGDRLWDAVDVPQHVTEFGWPEEAAFLVRPERPGHPGPTPRSALIIGDAICGQREDIGVPAGEVGQYTLLIGARSYGPGTELPAGLQAVSVPHGPSPGETALYSQSGGGTLIVGDAVLGEPMGRLGLPPHSDPGELASAARGLRALLARRLNRVLVAHGQSVMHDPVPLLQHLIFEHDPEACLIRPTEVRWGRAQLSGRRFGSRAAEYARLLALKVLDFELTELPPGRQSFPLHRHDSEEELFIITDGRGEVLTERSGAACRIAIGAGDVLAFPPRFQIAHAIVNTGDAPLRFYVFCAPAEVVEMADYPTSGARLERTAYGKWQRFYLPDRLDVPYFEGEPIDEAVE